MNDLQIQTSTENKPEYILLMEAAYGPPSRNGFGSAIFFEQIVRNEDLEQAAMQKYKYFVGENWERFGEEAWLSAWKQVYIREPESDHDIVAELRSLTDLDARLSVPMILDGLENAEAAKRALSTAYNHKDVVDLRVYTLGDGGVMSGLLVAGQRSNGETTFLVFLYD